LLTAVQLKLGVAVAIVPVGVSRVAAPGGRLLYVTVSIALVVLLAASRAVTVMTVVPVANGTAAIDQAVVPAATPLAPPLVDQLTCVTPTLSPAMPLTASDALAAEYVPVVVGVVTAMVGTVVSDAAGTVNWSAAPQGPAPAALEGRIHQTAPPGANVTPGLTVHVPVPLPHPTAAAV
jgi:hypothetical protein